MPKKLRPRTNWQPIRFHDRPEDQLSPAQNSRILAAISTSESANSSAESNNLLRGIESLLKVYRVFRHVELGPTSVEQIAALDFLANAQSALMHAWRGADNFIQMAVVDAASATIAPPDDWPLNEILTEAANLRGMRRMQQTLRVVDMLGTWISKARERLP